MIVFTRAPRVLMTMQDDGDRAKMTNGSGVWRLPGCHTPDELPALQPFFYNSIHIFLSSFFLFITQFIFFSLALFLISQIIFFFLATFLTTHWNCFPALFFLTTYKEYKRNQDHNRLTMKFNV